MILRRTKAKVVVKPPPTGIPLGQWLSRNLFKSPIHYALCMSEKEFYEELQSLAVPKGQYPSFMGSPTAHATTHHLLYKGRGQVAIVCLVKDKKRTTPEVMGLLVHEAVHIWQRMCQNIGEDNPSSEFEAYGIQWISQELIWAWNNWKGRRRHHGG